MDLLGPALAISPAPVQGEKAVGKLLLEGIASLLLVPPPPIEASPSLRPPPHTQRSGLPANSALLATIPQPALWNAILLGSYPSRIGLLVGKLPHFMYPLILFIFPLSSTHFFTRSTTVVGMK